MKLKEIFYGLGLKPSAREYPFELDTLSLPKEGEIQFARWQHPNERHKHFTQKAIDAIRTFLKPGDCAIDIGSHTGDSTLPIALAAGSQGTVFALEPNRYVYKILLANASLNSKKTNIVPLMFAATPDDGEFEFEYSDPGFCNGGLHQNISEWQHAHFFKLKVQGKNLLKFLQSEYPVELPRVKYIKIDTEGFDRTVVRSLHELFERNRPYLKSEIYQHLPQSDRFGFYDDLRALGYQIHKFNSDEDYQGQKLERADMTRWEHYDIFAVPEVLRK